MECHYERHTTTTVSTDGERHSESTSSVLVRELDDGEVGILLAGNNSILDPTLTPHMLTTPIANYNVESDDPSSQEDVDIDDDNWFPSLRRFSSIQGLSEDEDTSTEQPSLETLLATNIVEYDTSSDEELHHKKRKRQRKHRQKKSRRISKESRQDDDGSSGDDDHLHIGFVPIDVVCVCIE